MKFDYKECYDISVPLSTDLPSYPGDSEIELVPQYSIEKGDTANILQLKLSSHSGTHVDVPRHFLQNGDTLDDFSPEQFCGRAKIFDLSVEEKIRKTDIVNLDIKIGDIILFKTKNSDLWTLRSFQKRFIYLTPEAAEFLASKQIKAVGIDYLSIEEFRSKDHLTHQILLQNRILILEGINLKNIQPGEYVLFFFPLKLKLADGSPVRAVLFR